MLWRFKDHHSHTQRGAWVKANHGTAGVFSWTNKGLSTAAQKNKGTFSAHEQVNSFKTAKNKLARCFPPTQRVCVCRGNLKRVYLEMKHRQHYVSCFTHVHVTQ